MRTLPLIVTLAVGVALATPAEAGFRFSARIGAGSGVTAKAGSGAFWGERRVHPRPKRRPLRRFLFVPRFHDHHHREPGPAPAAVGPVPAPPVVATPAEPPPPPDPHGPLRLTPARGIVPAAAPYRIGEALPPDLPHVTLAWRQFDLPEPPAGRLYARVGRDVLLITAAGRIVESVLPPG